MENIVNQFGQDAGRIWNTLHEKGALTEQEILQNTRLYPNEFYTAVGWLARENKIRRDGQLYCLGDTNLTEKIGLDAGKIWDALNWHKEIDLQYLPKFSHLPLRDALCALGWLAREEKLKVKTLQVDKNQIIFGLK